MAQWDDFGGSRQPAAAGAKGDAPQQGGVGSAVTEVKEQVKDLAQQAREGTKDLAGQAKSQVNDLVAQGRDHTSQRLASFATALGDVAQRLEKEDAGGFGGWARRASEQADRAARYLKEKDLNVLVHDAQTLARRHPDLFLGGSLIAGVLVARFLKSSAERGRNGGGDLSDLSQRGDRGERGDRGQDAWREESGQNAGYRASRPLYTAQGGL